MSVDVLVAPLVLLVTIGALIGFMRGYVRRTLEADVAVRRPVGANGIVIGAEPLQLPGSETRAVLLIHGFGDTPQSLRPLATALQRAGWTVHVPLLPGHGRSLPAFARARCADWIAAAEDSYENLRLRYPTVAVAGISMGAALSVLLASRHPEIPSLVLLAPYLGMPRLLRFKIVLAWIAQIFMPYRRSTGGETSIHDPVARAAGLGIGVVNARLLSELRSVALRAEQALPLVKMPTLYLQSKEDNRISTSAALRHFKELGSARREQRWLTGCGHIITADYCKDEVAAQVLDWIERHR